MQQVSSLLVAAVALLACQLAHGQPRETRLQLPVADSPPAHLEPAEPGLSRYAERPLGIYENNCLVTFVITPAFDPELGVCVAWESAPDGAAQHFLATMRPSSNLFAALNAPEQPTVRKQKRRISVELADAIERAVGRAVLRARYPVEGFRGVDGENGYFSSFVWPLGTIYGMYHTRPAGVSLELRRLALDLEKFSQSPAPSSPAEEKPLIRRAAELEKIAARS